jgi:peroxiredoxin
MTADRSFRLLVGLALTAMLVPAVLAWRLLPCQEIAGLALHTVGAACWSAPPPQPTQPPLAARPAQNSESLPAAAPDFALQTIDGSTFRLSEQRGRVVGMYVMASWCGTCIPETQAWDRVLADASPRGLSAVAVSGDPGDTADDLRRFAALAKAQRPIWAVDPKGEFVRLFQVRSLDTTLIFDRGGQLVYRNSIPLSYDVLLREVDRVL